MSARLPSMWLAACLVLGLGSSAVAAEDAATRLRAIQGGLAVLGYQPGDDGYGPETQQAIEAYQRDNGLPIDGIASDALLQHMRSAHGIAPAPEPEAGVSPDTAVLQELRGPGGVQARGRATDRSRAMVRDIQASLLALGFDPGPADGEMRPQTARAIRDYQKVEGLPANGLPTLELLTRLETTQAERSGTLRPAGPRRANADCRQSVVQITVEPQKVDRPGVQPRLTQRERVTERVRVCDDGRDAVDTVPVAK